MLMIEMLDQMKFHWIREWQQQEVADTGKPFLWAEEGT